MTIKYLKLSIEIHGLDADDAAPDFLAGYLQAATKACLTGSQRDRFKFRNEFESDIEVEVEETAGKDGA